MENSDKLILVGIISSCSGIKGDVIVKSYTDKLEDICNLSIMTSDKTKITLKLIRKNSNGNLVCRLNNIVDRNEAEKWLKKKLFCYRNTLPIVQDGEFYIEDLKNLRVVNEAGEGFGTILNVCEFGAGTVVEIKLTSDKIIMLPFNINFFPIISHDYAVCTANEDNY